MTVNNQALQVQRFDDDTPYVQENLGLAKLINFYHKSYFHINITNLRTSFQNILSNTYFLTLKINETNNNFNILKQLEDRVQTIQDKLKLITHSKSKRALFNGLGTVVRYVTGNLDQSDLNNIMTNMDKLRNNEEIITLQNTRSLSILSKLEERFANNSLVISKNLKKLNSKLNQLNTEITIQQAVLTELLYVEAFEQFTSSLLTTITLSSQEKVNLAIINYQDMSHLYELLNTLFAKEELLPFSELHYFEILNICKLNAIISNTEIIFVLKIPILHIPTYNYQRIYSLIFKKNHVLILPTENVIENRYIDFLSEPCIELRNFALCNKILKTECNLKTLENCTIVQVNNQLYIKQLRNSSLLINTNKKVKLFDNCIKQEIVIKNPTLVLEACNLEIENEHYNSFNSSTNIKIPNFKISFERNAIMQIDSIKPFDDIKQLIKDNKISAQIQNLEWKHHTSWFSMISCVIVLLIFYTMFRYRIVIRRIFLKPKEKTTNEEHTVPLQQISSVRIYPCLNQELQT